MLSFLSRRHWGEIAGGRGFLQFPAQTRTVSSVGVRISSRERPSSHWPKICPFVTLLPWPGNISTDILDSLGKPCLTGLRSTTCVPEVHNTKWWLLLPGASSESLPLPPVPGLSCTSHQPPGADLLFLTCWHCTIKGGMFVQQHQTAPDLCSPLPNHVFSQGSLPDLSFLGSRVVCLGCHIKFPSVL